MAFEIMVFSSICNCLLVTMIICCIKVAQSKTTFQIFVSTSTRTSYLVKLSFWCSIFDDVETKKQKKTWFQIKPSLKSSYKMFAALENA